MFWTLGGGDMSLGIATVGGKADPYNLAAFQDWGWALELRGLLCKGQVYASEKSYL